MTAIDRSRCWAPVPRRWRHVVAGDVTVTEDGDLIVIIAALFVKAGVRVTYLLDGRDQFTTMDPDEVVDVLVPAPERDGLVLVDELVTHTLGREDVA